MENKQIRTGFYLPQLTVDELKEEASTKGISVSELLRRILDKHLGKY